MALGTEDIIATTVVAPPFVDTPAFAGSLDCAAFCGYDISVEYEWDDAKQRSNLQKHNVDFASIRDFEWDTAIVRSAYRHGETRYLAVGYIGDRLHAVVYTQRGQFTRIISLRRASRREEREFDGA